MHFVMNNYPLLVALAPLLAAIYSALPIGRAAERRYGFGVFAHSVAVCIAVIVLCDVSLFGGSRRVVISETPWAFLPTIQISLDRLSSVMMVVITSIGLVLYRYSVRYLQSDSGQSRYLALLAFAITTLLVMVSSSDLIVLFLAWQLLSWLLCLLAHNYSHMPTARSSFRTFIMLRAGDICFLGGVILAFQLYGTLEFEALFEQVRTKVVTLPLFGYEISGATSVAFLIFIGAMTKSAQIPLHMWLPDSLYAPTPIHGLLHAGIINAGGFLMTRLAPLYILSPSTLHVAFFIGLLTAILGSSMMLVQNDIKKTLGYSTIGQMGYMVMECGLGAFSLAIFHLIAHGLFKASIFLNCGDVIHATRQKPKRPFERREKTGTKGSHWLVGSLVSLALPLIVVTMAHKALNVPLLESQGLIIFLLFSWVTAAQAMLTLYRLDQEGSLKLRISLLGAVATITVIYLFAAELFTAFLYPSAETVLAYYQAAALPAAVFNILFLIAVVAITIGVMLTYAQRNGASFESSGKFSRLRTLLYLLLMNRLYIDGLIRRTQLLGRKIIKATSGSKLLLVCFLLVALVVAGLPMPSLTAISGESLLFLVAASFLVPLFPLHGLYMAAVTRTPGMLSLVLSVILPLAGIAVVQAMPAMGPEHQWCVSVLALVGAVYALVKASAEKRAPYFVAYLAVAFYSILWWYIAQRGGLTQTGVAYAGSVALVIGGILFAWDRLRIRYGDLALHSIGGLAQPMPKFGLCLALVVMAGIGLPPFGTALVFVGLFVDSAKANAGTPIVLLTWFGLSWYMFTLMQRLLFGPQRTDLRYQDLKPAEVAAFAGLLLVLIALIIAPEAVFATTADIGTHSTMELK